MRAPDWFRPLLEWFTWSEDEHFVTTTCRRCGHVEHYTHHFRPLFMLQDCILHWSTAACQGLLPTRPGEQV